MDDRAKATAGAVWEQGVVRPVALAELGEHYRRYRLADLAAEEAMVQSLRRYGQLAPVVVCLREGKLELLDGFKRRAAAVLMSLPTLSVRVLELAEHMAKAALMVLNEQGRPTRELEEAWIVQALVREDGLTQVEVAALLRRNKSWVCRRLALLEKLDAAVRADMRLGLVSATLARQLTRLPAGNQTQLLTLSRRDALNTGEVRQVIDLLQRATPANEAFILQQPREALRQAQAEPPLVRDARLSSSGNLVAKQLGHAVTVLTNLENWLRYPGRCGLQQKDYPLLLPQFERLACDTRVVAELLADLLLAKELFGDKTHERTAACGDRASLSGQGADSEDCPRPGCLPQPGAASGEGMGVSTGRNAAGVRAAGDAGTKVVAAGVL